MVAFEKEHIAGSVIPQLVVDCEGSRMGIDGFADESWDRGGLERQPAYVAADIFAVDIPRIVTEVRANLPPGNTNEWQRLSLLYSGGFLVEQMARLRGEQPDYTEAARLVGQGLAVCARDVRQQQVWASVLGKGLRSYISYCAQAAAEGRAEECTLREAEACRDALAEAFGPFGELILPASAPRPY